MDTIYYTFDDYDTDVLNIADLVNESDFRTDVVVSVLRGGAIPGVQLSHVLDKPLQTFAFSTRDKKVVDEDFKNLMTLFEYNKRVLFVDDINDTGETFKQILTYLTNQGVNRNMYRFASLVYNLNSDIKSDYYGMVIEKVDGSPWVKFWWEHNNA
jgi:hypoxanthine phosphoribosyltransferase